MSKHQNVGRVHSEEPVRNIRKFIRAYFQSESGKRALSRGPNRAGWGNAAMAVALQKVAA